MSGLINMKPNNPGKMNEIEVEPVEPTIARTCAKEVTEIATKYAKTTIPVVMM